MTNRRQFGIALGLGLVIPRAVWSEDEIIAPPEPTVVSWQELAQQGHTFEHWTPEEDDHWKWYRLERYTDSTWISVGISLPIHKQTGEAYQPTEGYLSPDRIPPYVLLGELPHYPNSIKQRMAPSQYDPQQAVDRLPDPEVQGRDGRPPSDWLTSLEAGELRSWLPTIEPPEATVSGMTFWVHLVRDHSFDPRRIEGLTEREFLLLHSAAHSGY